MKKTPAKWFVAGLVVMGIGMAGLALLRGQSGGDTTGDPAQELSAVRADLASMEGSRSRVQKMYERAKKQKDIIKTSCVHEKLVRIKNIIALAREQFSRYLMEKASGGTGASVPLRQKISMFKERVDDMVQEAQQCAGEAIAVTDKPVVQETIDPKIPQTDPTQPVGSIWVMPRPPEASPYF